MRISNILFVLLPLVIIFSNDLFAREISLSFDDAPKSSSVAMSGLERTKMIIKKLNETKVKRVAFYVNTKKLDRDDGLKRLKMYKNAGHLLGNHTHSHPNIRHIDTESYLEDFDRADELMKEHDILEKYFRYPYLRRGKTIEEVNKVHHYISQKGYVDAYVTVDNYDWYMDSQYIKSLKEGREIDYQKLEEYYVETLYKGVLFYEELAKNALNSNVKHVMLLHENDLAALFIDSFIRKLRSKGWKIISPEESYRDPMLGRFPRKLLNQGSGRVNALAVDRQYQGLLRSGLEDEQTLDKIFKSYKITK